MKLGYIKYIIQFISLFLVTAASAQDLKLSEDFKGFYTKERVCARNNNCSDRNSKKFLVSVRSNVMRLTDNSHKIKYILNFNDPTEQVVSTDYLDYLSKKSGVFKNLVKSFTVSNHKILDDGKEIDLDFNANIRFESIFGNMDAKLSLHINAKIKDNCPRESGSDEPDKVSCLAITSSKGIRFTEMETDLGLGYSNAVGLTLDFIFRIFSTSSLDNMLPNALHKKL